MIKKLLIILLYMVALSSYAYAQETNDHSQHDDHSDHHMDHADHADHDHSDHDMDHSGHDHSAHDHAGHDMDHSDHDMDHKMHDHSTHDLGGHDISEHDDHDSHAGHDHSMHGDHDDGHHGHHDHHHHEGHYMDDDGNHIMGENKDKLPSSCTSISEEIEITVRAGTKYAKQFPGTTFAFDQQEWRVKPCSKITWHFINEDSVRHQFMIHGLPRYLYHLGMFHMESTGPRELTATMIVPAADETYLAHCDIAQHMEKGMKAQLVVGNGGEDIPSIPGLTPYVLNDKYEAEDLPEVPELDDKGQSVDPISKQITDFYDDNIPIPAIALIGILFGVICAPLLSRIIALRKPQDSETT